MKLALQKEVLNLPAPKKLSFYWKFGSILVLMLGVQLLSGMMLAMCYFANSEESFFVIDLMVRDFNFGFLFRTLHANGASLYFFFMYIHMGRGIFFRSFYWKGKTWFVGVVIFLVSMATAFLGYVLPWGKMSFWAATVITKLFSAFPLIGTDLVKWILGGFSVGTPTLTRFFYLHSLFPFLVSFLVLIHILSLHSTGSSDPFFLGLKKWCFKTFHPYFSAKDIYGFFLVFFLLSFFLFFFPYAFMDSDKFKEASALVTPLHMQPEWYFLPAYTVLRSIPNKLGGVIGLFIFKLVMLIHPLTNIFLKVLPKNLSKSLFKSFFLTRNLVFWVWVGSVFGLLWIGMCGVEGWYLALGRGFSFLYFFFIFFLMF